MWRADGDDTPFGLPPVDPESVNAEWVYRLALEDPEQFATLARSLVATDISAEDANALLAEIEADPFAFLVRYSGDAVDALHAIGQYLGITTQELVAGVTDSVASNPGQLYEDGDYIGFFQTFGAPEDLTPEELDQIAQWSATGTDGAPDDLPPTSETVIAYPDEWPIPDNLLAEDVVLGSLQVMQLLNDYWAQQAIQLGIQGAAEDAGVPWALISSFNITNPAAMDFLRQQTGYLITNIDERTRQLVAESLWAAYRGGDGFFGMPRDRLATWLQEQSDLAGNLLANMSRYRAMMITRTETARAVNFGQMVAYAKMGVKWKRWVVNAGACQICIGNAEIDPIPLDADFPSGVKSPPQHPLCRCSVSPVAPAEFNPEDWKTPPNFLSSDWEAMLFDPAYGYYPNVDWPSLDDMYSGEAPPRSPTAADIGLIDPDTLPPDLAAVLTADSLNSLASSLADTADSAATDWATTQGVDLPQTDAALSALDGQDFADGALWSELGNDVSTWENDLEGVE